MARFWVAEAEGDGRAVLYGTLYRTFAVAAFAVPAGLRRRGVAAAGVAGGPGRGGCRAWARS